MKWIKTFEAWAGQPLLTTSLDVELEYKNCKDCNALYQVYKPKSINCRFCDSRNLLNLTEDEYYNEMQNRLDPDEFEDALKERDKVRNTFVDLTINQDDYTN
jgi:hypothetical protein